MYRVGSVSKLFTDVAIMQLVEQGKVDLDAPVTTYVTEFHPHNPYGRPITLRQLMSHRAGLVREPPIGNYFDSTSPPLAATIASLNGTTLVYPPETHTKYSNAAIAAVGYVLERMSGKPFATALSAAVLEPLGMSMTGFEPTPALTRNLAPATMWTLDGRTFPAPTFQLGIAPAGSMYTTVTDLARFVSALFAGGRGSNGQLLKPETIAQMWTPQFARPGERTGYGIGFRLGSLDGRRSIGHDGAIYGFATTLQALPDEKLGVIIVTTRDGANAAVDEIGEAALRAMLAVRGTRATGVTVAGSAAAPPCLTRTPPHGCALATACVTRWCAPITECRRPRRRPCRAWSASTVRTTTFCMSTSETAVSGRSSSGSFLIHSPKSVGTRLRFPPTGYTTASGSCSRVIGRGERRRRMRPVSDSRGETSSRRPERISSASRPFGPSPSCGPRRSPRRRPRRRGIFERPISPSW
ncbi:MAG: hypothetical protein DMD26_18560 [Gemmatimonadetes bacterium]|nr:MAG: hypothetical protein DMD26_18560 [Gemmatimonadota bacterium]